MENKKIFGVPIALVLIGMLVIGGATAALLTMYVNMTATTIVDQSIVYADETTTKTYSFDGNVIAGTGYSDLYMIKNRAEVPGMVDIETTGIETGINVGFYTLNGFTDSKTTTTTSIVVEDLGTSVLWTIDVDETNPAYANGHASMGLVIGNNNDILYQIHANDGSDSNFDWGTWLYSPFNTTLVSSCAWNGWHSGCVNTEVSDLSWVTASGERDLSSNAEGIYTIEIDKSMLDGEEFNWVLYLSQDAVFTDSNFNWVTPLFSDMHTANVGAEILNPFNLQPKSENSFISIFNFDVTLTPDTYTIETEIVPI